MRFSQWLQGPRAGQSASVLHDKPHRPAAGAGGTGHQSSMERTHESMVGLFSQTASRCAVPRPSPPAAAISRAEYPATSPWLIPTNLGHVKPPSVEHQTRKDTRSPGPAGSEKKSLGGPAAPSLAAGWAPDWTPRRRKYGSQHDAESTAVSTTPKVRQSARRIEQR